MPHFHFHVHNGVDAFDHEGIEMPDLATARAAALESVRHLMSDEIRMTGCICRMRSVKTLQVGLSLAEPGQAAWASA